MLHFGNQGLGDVSDWLVFDLSSMLNVDVFENKIDLVLQMKKLIEPERCRLCWDLVAGFPELPVLRLWKIHVVVLCRAQQDGCSWYQAATPIFGAALSHTSPRSDEMAFATLKLLLI